MYQSFIFIHVISFQKLILYIKERKIIFQRCLLAIKSIYLMYVTVKQCPNNSFKET